MVILRGMETSVILVLFSFAVMGLAFYLRRRHAWHIALMGSVILFDMTFPVWLYLTHDWKRRLIDEGELFSSLIWMHLFLIITLFSLYVLQALAGHQLYAGRREAREEHRVQSRGIFVVRIFVFLTGALLIAPD
ncbi:MAG: hypothetical protein R8K53_10290 [Mariprofundaceae bacterium]